MYDSIRKAQAGDREAFAQLIETHKHALFRVARGYFREPMDIEDAISETVLRCWEKLPDLKNPEYFKTWMIRILINQCNDMLRSSRGLVALEEIPERAAQEETCFGQLMECLSESNRVVLDLYYGEGYKVKEISEMLELPLGTVTSRLKRGREELARIWEEEQYEARESV